MVITTQKDSFAERFNEALDDKGFPPKGHGRQKRVAERYGVSQAAARKWLEGEAIPTMQRIGEIAQDLNINGEWLLTQRGPKRTNIAGNQHKGLEILEWMHPDELPAEKYVFIRCYNVRFSAGNKSLIYDPMPGPLHALPSDWIKQHKLRSKDLLCVKAAGDSMEERIQDGDVLIIDRSQDHIINRKIYALQYGDELLIKRLFRRADSGIIMHSDNKEKWPEITVTASEMRHVKIIGRVIRVEGDI